MFFFRFICHIPQPIILVKSTIFDLSSHVLLFPFQNPNPIVDLYNKVLDYVLEICTCKRLLEYSWPSKQMLQHNKNGDQALNCLQLAYIYVVLDSIYTASYHYLTRYKICSMQWRLHLICTAFDLYMHNSAPLS